MDASSTVTGVKGMLTGNKELGSILGKLFAQFKTQVSVDLGQFEDVLKPAGLIGSGQATIGLAMLKKEEGPYLLSFGFKITLSHFDFMLDSKPTLRVFYFE